VGAAESGPNPSPSVISRGIRRLRLRTWLALIVLVAMVTAIGLGSAEVLGQEASGHEALAAQNASHVLDSIIEARIALSREEMATLAIVYARQFGIGEAKLDRFMHINFKAELTAARAAVDAQKIFRDNGEFATNYTQLVVLRHAVDAGKSSFDQVLAVTQKIESAMDERFSDASDAMAKAANILGSGPTRTRIEALQSAFAALTFGSQQSTLAPEILVGTTATPPVESLIAATTRWQMATQELKSQLGPAGSAAWHALEDSPETSSFNDDVRLAISVGLHRAAPPYVANPILGSGFLTAELATTTLEVQLVLAASADLRTTTQSQAAAATRDMVLDLIALFSAVSAGIVAALLLDRSIGRPIARITEAAGAIRGGEFNQPPLDVTGPLELILATEVFNEMSSTLHAVHTSAVALASGDVENPMLQTSLLGETGKALHGAMTMLRESVQINQSQRELLEQRTTHDALTGLLNREAAVEALQRDLDRTQRTNQNVQLLYIDMDGLKAINDSFGHDAGDVAIRAFARGLQLTTRKSDIVARIGGDDFIVGWPGTGEGDEALRLANRIIRQAMATVAVVGDNRISVRCSVGIATSSPVDRNIEVVMKRAEFALCDSKKDGGAVARVYGEKPWDLADEDLLDSHYLSVS
jgi:diguanylate cyclase (GGDEF)-like protein